MSTFWYMVILIPIFQYFWDHWKGHSCWLFGWLLNISGVWRQKAYIGNLQVTSVCNFWQEGTEGTFGFLRCQNVFDPAFSSIVQTNVPFCPFLPGPISLHFIDLTYAYIELTYAFNSPSNPANIEQLSLKNSTNLAFSTVSKISESGSLSAETSSSE